MGRIRTLGKRLRAPLQIEELENRLTPSGLAPTGLDQLMLVELNAARANPAAYGQSIGVNLSNVAPSQPLAWSPLLIAGAQAHSQSMNQYDYFGHDDTSGADPSQRMTNEGYSWVSWGESIAAGFATPADALDALITDGGVPSMDHRQQLLALTPLFQNQSQIGIGIVLNGTGPYQDYYTIDTAAPANPLPFLTGMVYNDANSNGQYDVGEGMAGVTIRVLGVGSTGTFASGGYEMQLNPGTYTVVASGGGLPAAQIYQVSIGGQNSELDIVSGKTSGYQNTLVNWVQQTYQSYLFRAATSTEVTAAINLLASGGSQSAVVNGIKQTAEYRQDNTVWLTQVYYDATGKAIPQATLNSDLATLAGSGTRTGVAQAIANSAAAFQHQLTPWLNATYQSYLNRAPTTAEVNKWLTIFDNGGGPNQVVVCIVTSAEFTARSGQTNAAYIQSLYVDILGRKPSTAELNAWLGNFQHGWTRTMMAQSLLNGSEHMTPQVTQFIDQIFATFLGRQPTVAELKKYVNLWMTGTSRAAIEAMIVTGSEYYSFISV